MSIGTADLAFEGAGSATVAWGIARPAATGYAGWSMFFSATGSAAASCNSAAYDDQVDLWTGSATDAPAPLPAGEYHVDPVLGCGSDALCSAMYIADGTVEWAEVELLESDITHLRGSLMGSAFSGSGAETTFYGDFDAEVCAH